MCLAIDTDRAVHQTVFLNGTDDQSLQRSVDDQVLASVIMKPLGTRSFFPLQRQPLQDG